MLFRSSDIRVTLSCLELRRHFGTVTAFFVFQALQPLHNLNKILNNTLHILVAHAGIEWKSHLVLKQCVCIRIVCEPSPRSKLRSILPTSPSHPQHQSAHTPRPSSPGSLCRSQEPSTYATGQLEYSAHK